MFHSPPDTRLQGIERALERIEEKVEDLAIQLERVDEKAALISRLADMLSSLNPFSYFAPAPPRAVAL